MAKSKLFQNMNINAKPEETVKNDVLEGSRPKRGKYGQKKYPSTNLKISTHQRNGLVALTLMGKTKNQKTAISYLLDHYYDSLLSDGQKQFDALVKMLDDKYSRLHHSK